MAAATPAWRQAFPHTSTALASATPMASPRQEGAPSSRKAPAAPLLDDQVHNGRLVKWTDERGFGFILPEEGGDTVFVHISGFLPAARRPIEGDVVSFQIDRSDRRTKAVNVRLKALPLPDTVVVSYGVGVLFLTLLALSSFGFIRLGNGMKLYLVMSVITFGFYYVDKKRAETKRWRIHSTTLHVLEAIGGWPGALLAMSMLRHLTRKHDHLVMLSAIIAIHMVAWLVWYLRQ
jgi:uncharacterized membrane protein YsdA (DUF1294 family)/cold shock CspA family protein